MVMQRRKFIGSTAGLKAGDRLDLLDPDKDVLRTGYYRGFNGPHIVLGTVEMTVVTPDGELAVEPISFQKDPKLAGAFEGRGFTTYRVVSYSPGLVFRLTDRCGIRTQVSHYLIARHDEVPPGATTPVSAWQYPTGLACRMLTVAANGRARPHRLFSNPELPPVLTGLPMRTELAGA